MMKLTYSYFGGYHICLIFFQVIASTSENLMVTAPTEHLVARVGGQAELSCQVTPPRSVEYMEVRWFRSGHSQPVYLYRGSRGGDGEAAPEYENRIELVKEAIGKGKVALRIRNISIADDGSYRCSFNDSVFSYVASVNLSVAALGLKMRIHVQSSGYGGFIVGCFSEGWFPRPRMEWRDSKGEVVPYSSISHSQDADRFFHVNMTLFRNQSQESITCCVINPLTGEEKQANLILSNALFNENNMKKIIFIFISISIVLFLLYILIVIFIKSGVMGTTEVLLFAHCVAFNLLQIVVLSMKISLALMSQYVKHDQEIKV
ncbi:selection and upkeep of intraepithelial T-cells protein 8-like [Phodopus roborovskii]|uniref:selection and upkeep of intraepithelial T-cells protein 8-like n=1 Tax=Phodopus roborovskii TaxID=109678 RepID=UPI0021E42A34|nr:selection and upkeep of intraepithelial T-cells protein 8-like [Phodopus roborovskii]